VASAIPTEKRFAQEPVFAMMPRNPLLTGREPFFLSGGEAEMKSKLSGLFALLVTASTLAQLCAQPWLAVGTRERAMGSAGVAVASGGSALYWNPANLARDSDNLFNIRFKTTSWDTSVFVDAEARGNIVKSFDELLNIFNNDIAGLQASFDAGNANASQVQSVFNAVGLIGDLGSAGEGLVGDVGGASVIKLGNFAISYRMLGHVAATMQVNLINSALSAAGSQALEDIGNALIAETGTITNDFAATDLVQALVDIGVTDAGAAEALAFQAEQALGINLNDPLIQSTLNSVIAATQNASTNTLEENDSFVLVRGIALQEIALGYGIPLFEGKVRVGIAPKVMVGRTFFQTFSISDNTDGVNNGDDIVNEIQDLLDGAEKSENKFSIDLGFAWAPNEWFEFGLSGRNLIPAEFDFGPSNVTNLNAFKVDPQARAGVIFRPLGWNWLKIGADIDLTTNSNSLFPNHSERILGGGVEITPKLWILQPAIRLGVFDNIAESGDGFTFTGGLGLRLGIFYIAADGRIATETTQVEQLGSDIPDRAGFGVNFGINVRF
jgi:hypothetical protein